MPAKEHEEIEQNLEKNGDDVADLEEDEDRPRSLLKRTDQMCEWRRPSRVVKRSNRSNKGVKPIRFREM